MLEFASVTTGSPVSYIELTNSEILSFGVNCVILLVSVSIVLNEVANVFCALFHDRSDGPSFGRLLCSEVLSCFVEEYQEDMGALVGRNLKDFQGFHHRIADVIQNSIKPVLVGVQAQRGVQKALLVTEDTIVSPSSDVDQLGILANLQAFLGFSTDIMGFVEEEGSSVVLDGPASRILLYRIQTSILIVVLSTNVEASKYQSVLEESVHTLTQVCHLNSNLHLVSR